MKLYVLHKNSNIYNSFPGIKDVIFNDPATIIFWTDGTKTVVKCQEGELYDPEKGFTMAVTKKAFGNQGNYFETVKKWTDKYEYPDVESIYPKVPKFDFAEAFEERLRTTKLQILMKLLDI